MLLEYQTGCVQVKLDVIEAHGLLHGFILEFDFITFKVLLDRLVLSDNRVFNLACDAFISLEQGPVSLCCVALSQHD